MRWAGSVCSVLLLSACGNSPFLNHRNESDPAAQKSTGCQYQSSKLQSCLEITWISGPAQDVESSLRARLQPAGRILTVKPWMPDMGHGTGEPPSIRLLSDGTYSVSNIFFIMAGQWDLHFEIEQNHIRDEIIVPVKL